MSILTNRIREVSRRPATLGQVPEGAVTLAMGEPAGGTPQPIIEAAEAALRAGRTTYPPMLGTPELRTAVAAHLDLGTNGARPLDQVVVTHGAAAGLAAVFLAHLDPGDRVVLPEPTYSLYADLVAMAGAQTEWVPARSDGTLDPERVLAGLGGARMLVLCHPSNPTGEVLTPAVLQALIERCEELGVLCVVDEAYRDILLDDEIPFQSSADWLGTSEHVVLVGTFSKTFSMTGWRLGYAAGPASLLAHVGTVHQTFNGQSAMFVQDAAVRALEVLPTVLPPLLEHYRENRRLVVRAMHKLGSAVTFAEPGGAFYAFPRIQSDLTSDELVERLTAGGVLVRSGREFGPSGEGFVRLSFSGERAAVAEGLRRFTATVRQLV
ncbi:pyridoxal phosphate-dependent aminotransferase [Ornithinimicrobium cavernae]|uniref:pyridoxal phosphate-dependent aminotransferase n=1 Tax=Ornithinimicrobium cavernae TaxID=2666047 RepID=UPI000D69B9D9|nr:pyridoxal phosphate-dependent aminotransferase [Ornithinimicrobium cavernae]